VRGTYRHGLDGHYLREINGGVTPAIVSRNGERGRRLQEKGDDMWGPPVSVRRREVKVPVRGGKKMGRGRTSVLG
jgi:hypothetical protein